MSATATAVDPTTRIIPPTHGLPLAIMVLSSIFLVVSVVAVSLRTHVRTRKRILGLDDTFVIAGCIAYTAATCLANYATFVGLGRRNEDLNAWQQSEAMKYYVIWILVYVVALATVKSSICMTILRIASMKKDLRITVYILLAVTWASFFITFIGTLLYCHPTRAMWDTQLILSGKGHCAPVDTFIIIAHTATVSTICTDLALVVVPAIMLWNTQMKKQSKLQAFGLLSFASVASIITMVRIPYVNKFGSMTDLPFWVAHIILCSNIETGIGCIASSIPSLRHYLHRDDSDNNSRGISHKPSPRINAINQQRGGRIGKSQDDWETLHDGESDRSVALLNTKTIKKQQTYEVNIEMRG